MARTIAVVFRGHCRARMQIAGALFYRLKNEGVVKLYSHGGMGKVLGRRAVCQSARR